MKTLELKNISKNYDGINLVLDSISLELDKGKFLVLLGPSGCGKSTLLRIIAGLEETDSGQVIINGSDKTNAKPKDRNIGMVFQNYALYPHMTVRENLAFPLKIKKVPKNKIDSAIKQISELIELNDLLSRLPKELSGGQRQRVALGRALIKRPDIYLFDEPLSNLDAKLRNSLRKQIIQVHKETSGTSVYVTHDQTEAMTMSDIIVILDKGQIQQIGSPIDVYNNPKNLFVARFIGSPEINIIEVEALSEVQKSFFNLQTEEVTYIGIRPEKLNITENDSIVNGTVTYIEEMGFEKIVYFDKFNLRMRTKVDIELKRNYNLKINLSDVIHFNKNGDAV